MGPREIKPGVYWVGAVDWDRRLFDCLIPLPDGTSYNAFLVRGSDKTALIDTVDPTMQRTLLDNLDQLGVNNIDYIIANHAEPDHSGTIPQVLEKYPAATVLATPRCKDMLIDLLMVPEERLTTVNDGETISLGDRTLEFTHIPWVHWPETMATYLKEDRILFSCDFFGSHLATSDLYVTDQGRVYEAAKRYYAEIMMPFRNNVQKNLEKVKGYAIDIIAPSHGPLHNRPDFIMEAYRNWADDEPKDLALVVYVSMHGSTRKMVEYLVGALTQRSVPVQQFLVNALKPKLRYISVIGSYGWGGKAVEQLSGMVPNLKAEILEPVLSKGAPREAVFQALDNMAATVAAKHKEGTFAQLAS
jgi:flavorubredoxin